MSELLATLQTPSFVERRAVHKPNYIIKAKKALKKAFTYQVEGRCFSFVELLSTCPTNWGITPIDAVKWVDDHMMPYYPLGTFKTPETTEAAEA